MTTISANTKRGKTFSLKKNERLCSKKAIDKLFADGDSFLQYPLKMVFLKTELPAKSPVQVGFTASKKNFKRAVSRNRIKRLLREAYRLNKHIVNHSLEHEQLAIFIIYIGKQLPKYSVIETAMIKGLSKITNKISEQNIDGNGQPD